MSECFPSKTLGHTLTQGAWGGDGTLTQHVAHEQREKEAFLSSLAANTLQPATMTKTSQAENYFSPTNSITLLPSTN